MLGSWQKRSRPSLLKWRLQPLELSEQLLHHPCDCCGRISDLVGAKAAPVPLLLEAAVIGFSGELYLGVLGVLCFLVILVSSILGYWECSASSCF